MTRNELISTLQDLIETSKDGERGFSTCAENVDAPELKSVFLEAAIRCQKAAADLQDIVRRLGGNPDEGSSLASSAHRAWIDIKSAITGKDEDSILAEIERGEQFAEQSYRNALVEDLPDEIRTIIEAQYQGLQGNLNRIRALRARYAR